MFASNGTLVVSLSHEDTFRVQESDSLVLMLIGLRTPTYGEYLDDDDDDRKRRMLRDRTNDFGGLETIVLVCCSRLGSSSAKLMIDIGLLITVDDSSASDVDGLAFMFGKSSPKLESFDDESVNDGDNGIGGVIDGDNGNV